MTPRLEVKELSHAFGGLVVADNINLTLERGARTALIGPNGAGKTTLVNLIAGTLSADQGEITLEGNRLTGAREQARVGAGIVRTFQLNRLFRDLTVADNVRIAVLQRRRLHLDFLRLLTSVPDLDQEVDGLLATLRLKSRRDCLVRTLAYGEQRLLEIVLALALKPRVLLLDEPAAGVPQGEAGVILDVVSSLPADLSVLLIEHDMDVVFRFARHIIVLVSGRIFLEGKPQAVAQSEAVKEIYFGRGRRGRNHH